MPRIMQFSGVLAVWQTLLCGQQYAFAVCRVPLQVAIAAFFFSYLLCNVPDGCCPWPVRTCSYMPRPALSTLSSGPPVASTSAPHYNPNAIIASKRQQGNPLLRHIRNVRWQFGDVSPDYVLGQNTCALFISLR